MAKSPTTGPHAELELFSKWPLAWTRPGHDVPSAKASDLHRTVEACHAIAVGRCRLYVRRYAQWILLPGREPKD
jgi:hypothetical protein